MESERQSLGWEMNLNAIQKQIQKLDFYNAYNNLSSANYDFSIENVARDFKKVKSITMYAFLMFAISMEESTAKHITICNYLYFFNPYINGADQLIRWHILRAWEMFPQSASEIYRWVINVYGGNPDCPFTDNELQKIKSGI